MKYLGAHPRQPRRNKLRTRADRRRHHARRRPRLPAAHHAGRARRACSNTLANNTRISVHNKAGIVYPMPYSFTAQSAAGRRRRRGRGADLVRRRLRRGRAASPFRTSPSSPSRSAPVYPDYPHRAAAARRLPALPRRRHRRPPDDAASTAGRSATASRCAAPCGRSTSTSASSARSPTSARRMLWFNREYLDQALKAPGPAGPRHRRHDLGARRRSEPRQRDHARDRRHVAQQRRRDRVRDREELLRQLLRLAEGLRHHHPDRHRRWWRCASCSSPPTPPRWRVRERSGEIAVLKAIGFGRRVIFGTLLAEAVVALQRRRRLLGVLLALGLTARPARLRRLERHARPARQLHRHRAGDRPGHLPVAVRRHARRRRAVVRRGAQAGGGVAARGVLSIRVDVQTCASVCEVRMLTIRSRVSPSASSAERARRDRRRIRTSTRPRRPGTSARARQHERP